MSLDAVTSLGSAGSGKDGRILLFPSTLRCGINVCCGGEQKFVHVLLLGPDSDPIYVGIKLLCCSICVREVPASLVVFRLWFCLAFWFVFSFL